MLLAEWKSKRKGGSKKLSPTTLESVILQNVLQDRRTSNQVFTVKLYHTVCTEAMLGQF